MRFKNKRTRIIGRLADGSSRANRVRPKRRGSEVLEMALLILPLSMLIFGGIEFGFFFFLQHTVQAAAREGARAYVPLGAQTQAIAQTKAQAVLKGALGASQLGNYTITATPDGSGNVTVVVSADWNTVGVKLMKFITKQKITGTAVMRMESEN